MNFKNKILSCAPETFSVLWNFINWDKVAQNVKSLQCRIAKATIQGKRHKAKALQWLMAHSFSAKLLAVKRVTSNKGKRTSGVDKAIWDTPTSKLKAVLALKSKGYAAIKKGLYTQEEWKNEAAWNTHYERQGNASIIFTCTGTSIRNVGR